MSNQRGTFAKRQREMELKDKARAKEARRAAKRNEERPTKGPQIAWDEAVQVIDSPLPPLPTDPPSETPSDPSPDDSTD